jgi:hypothetical protein
VKNMHVCSFGHSLATGKINNIKIHTISNAVPNEEKIAPALISMSLCNLCISFKKFLLLLLEKGLLEAWSVSCRIHFIAYFLRFAIK